MGAPPAGQYDCSACALDKGAANGLLVSFPAKKSHVDDVEKRPNGRSNHADGLELDLEPEWRER